VRRHVFDPIATRVTGTIFLSKLGPLHHFEKDKLAMMHYKIKEDLSYRGVPAPRRMPDPRSGRQKSRC
jgi:hypothetical protein